MRLMRMKELKDKTGLSPAMVYKLMNAGKFPESKRISEGRVAWLESDIDAWIASL